MSSRQGRESFHALVSTEVSCVNTPAAAATVSPSPSRVCSSFWSVWILYDSVSFFFGTNYNWTVLVSFKRTIRALLFLLFPRKNPVPTYSCLYRQAFSYFPVNVDSSSTTIFAGKTTRHTLPWELMPLRSWQTRLLRNCGTRSAGLIPKPRHPFSVGRVSSRESESSLERGCASRFRERGDEEARLVGESLVVSSFSGGKIPWFEARR